MLVASYIFHGGRHAPKLHCKMNSETPKASTPAASPAVDVGAQSGRPASYYWDTRLPSISLSGAWILLYSFCFSTLWHLLKPQNDNYFKQSLFLTPNKFFFFDLWGQRVRRIKKRAPQALFFPKTHLLKPQNDFFKFVGARG